MPDLPEISSELVKFASRVAASGRGQVRDVPHTAPEKCACPLVSHLLSLLLLICAPDLRT